MANSKVILNGTTLMDVTQDSVTAETLLEDETATRKDGVRITGTARSGGAVDSVNGYTGTVVLATSDLQNDSGYITGIDSSAVTTALGYTPYDSSNPSGYVDATGAASAAPVASVNGQTGTVTLSIPTKTSDLTNDSNFMSGMTILSYGHSTYNDFLTAYQSNHVVYCRASSNTNPGTGSQNRMAFMAYINNETTPTEVEFQYYRSVSSHSDSQQGDQMYVYKLTKTGGWTVTVRESYTKIVAGTGLTSSYSNGVLTISLA